MDSHYLDALTAEQLRDVVLEAHGSQGGGCLVCERPIDLAAAGEQAPDLVHIRPLESGGQDAPHNIGAIHAGCRSPRVDRALTRPPRPAAAATPVAGAEPETGERTYRSALTLTVLGAVIPGSAYLAAGRRRLGSATLAIVVVLLLVAIVVLLRQPDLTTLVAELISRPTLLENLGIGVLVLGAAWIVVIATGHRMLLPGGATRRQQIVGAALAFALAAAVAAPSIVAAQYAFATRDLIEKVFGNPVAGDPAGANPPIDRDDPWKNIPRLNLLILGGDSTSDGGLTTNTMIVASIDTATGDAVLVGLPRNLQKAPIPADNPLSAIYPTGYQCGSGATACLLSGLYTEAKVTRADLFTDDPDPGLTTLRDSVGEITGLPINYSMLVDLEGFQRLVDALGGVDLDVGPNPVPIVDLDANGNPLPPDPSTQYVPPGAQHLDGNEALAFARERSTASSRDEDRILRQRAVIAALINQADPIQVLIHYLELASTAGDTITTDVPAALLPALVHLSRLVLARGIRTLPITSSVIATTNPDFNRIRQLVQSELTAGG